MKDILTPVMNLEDSIKGQPKINVSGEKCSGCLLCALACSFHRGGQDAFQLSQSRILIRRVGGKQTFTIGFLESCDSCGLCVDYCLSGALIRARE